ncbi:MAG: AMP-binding protein [Ornithinimicrobium sp.]
MPALDLSAGVAHDLSHQLARALDTDRDVIVSSSGSTGSAKRVVLPAQSLLASARAAHEVLGGPGQWLAALSPAHVGGLQVWVRSYLSGTAPVDVSGEKGFTAKQFVAAAAHLRTDRRRYVSLVPAQILRLLADPAGQQALRSFDRVLIGGAALATTTANALTTAGISWTHTYGMSETCGGCVYDGRPLPGVVMRAENQGGGPGSLWISGSVLARAYADDPELTRDAFVTQEGTRWFRTSDLGLQDPLSGRWRVLGRADDIINTGGHKVHPDVVRDALLAVDAVDEAAVVGVPDPQWGQAVAALLVPSPSHPDAAALLADPRGWLRQHLRAALPAHALPTRIEIADTMPRLPSGKTDLRGAQAAFTQEDDRI